MSGVEAVLGGRMHALIEELYPICRSITGDGLRATLARIAREIPLTTHEVPSGTPVFDWAVPDEWSIREAYIETPSGERVVDFERHNLHVVNYSVPVDRTMPLSELRGHLRTLPDQPDLIPYRTTYYTRDWGFCLPHRLLKRLEDGQYRVRIDASLEPGHLTYGECRTPGRTADEILISCHCCHPSLANDNLSGIAVAIELARHVLSLPAPHYTYRFVFIPGTIGSITWLARNRDATDRIRHGLVLSCVGDAGRITYKRSRRGSAMIDRAVAHVLGVSGRDHEITDFVPYGYDERQYGSPGFDLPVGSLTRTPNGRFPEYHTSADNLELVRPEALEDTVATCIEVFDILERDRMLVNQNPCCEPQLGRRGLYSTTGGRSRLPGYELALLWVLNQSDGEHSLFDIAERSGLEFRIVREAADALLEVGLVADVGVE